MDIKCWQQLPGLRRPRMYSEGRVCISAQWRCYCSQEKHEKHIAMMVLSLVDNTGSSWETFYLVTYTLVLTVAWFSGWVRYNAPTTIHTKQFWCLSQTIDRSTVFMSCSYRLELKCVPLEDLFRTNPGVKSTQVRSVKEPDITDL